MLKGILFLFFIFNKLETFSGKMDQKNQNQAAPQP
jgi:hypothetical protein